jgi:RNA polymerase sigma factor (sigma-70 family)
MIQLDSMSAAAATTAASPSDADLVRRCLSEGADAFSAIVARYQTLVCSVTYNGTGSLSRSEDLAQEVFVTAWKELRQLREPEKLRPWLCGIARRLTANTRRREGREPVCAADELADEHHTSAPGPAEEAITREEEAILWRSLEQIPENYREPLILFYREGQSVEHVAAALDLTGDAARQRLSRGRKLLQEQVANFIEGALRMSTPGRAFTFAVIAALPVMKASATAATLGTAAAKSGLAAKGIGAVGLGSAMLAMLGILVGPIVGCLGAWFGIKMSLETAGSERERKLIRRQAFLIFTLVFLFVALMVAVIPISTHFPRERVIAGLAAIAVLVLAYAASIVGMTIRYQRLLTQARLEDAAQLSLEAVALRKEAWKTFEYKSPWTFLGLPLIHVRTGRPAGEKLQPAKGWIAIGDLAYGALFASGGLAIAPISVGGISFGLFAMGGISWGLVAFAGAAIGLYGATGGLAVGYLAHGGGAAAWHAADGAFAAARDFACGGVAHAAQANNSAARQAITSMSFFRWAEWNVRCPILFGLGYLPFLLILTQARRARRVLRKT